MADDETRSSGSTDSISASYDLLSLPGMIISILEDGTATSSTGTPCTAPTCMLVCHPEPGAAPAGMSLGTTDSSILLVGLGERVLQRGGCANQFRIPFTQPAMIDMAALMMLLGGFVALLVETAEQNLQLNGVLQKFSAE